MGFLGKHVNPQDLVGRTRLPANVLSVCAVHRMGAAHVTIAFGLRFMPRLGEFFPRKVKCNIPGMF